MVHAMSIIAAFMLATALAQAAQPSSGGECTSDNVPQNTVSLLQTNNKIAKDGGEDTSSGTGNGLAKTGGSTCFSKGVDVCFGDCFDDSAICKQVFLNFGQMMGDSLHLGYDPDSRTLCITGSGVETRAASTVAMIKDAVTKMDKDCTSLSQFGHKVIYIHDNSDCSHDMAYSVRTWTNGCKTKLIPDFSFYKWAEAGLLPDYEHLTPLLARLGNHPATESRCGLAGNVNTNVVRKEFAKKFDHSALFDIVTPRSRQGPGGKGGRISMEDQVKRWSCFVELPGFGYSGRLPYLLHSGRPILMVERRFSSMATTFYSDSLKPWVHYIPVKHDMSDLAEKAEFALGITPGSNATKIAAAAKEFALTHLSYDAAIKYLADTLLELKQAS